QFIYTKLLTLPWKQVRQKHLYFALLIFLIKFIDDSYLENSMKAK
ncbi:hypothetical protein HMPREF1383_01899, partial [Enterococcus faecium V689]